MMQNLILTDLPHPEHCEPAREGFDHERLNKNNISETLKICADFSKSYYHTHAFYLAV